MTAILFYGCLRNVDAVEPMSLLRKHYRICSRTTAYIQNIENAVSWNTVCRELLAGPGDLLPLGIFLVVKGFDVLAHVFGIGRDGP